MSGIMSMVLGAKTAIAAAVDAYFNLVSLLLPGDGTNGAQNNTFLDSSTNNFTITRNGNTTQGTFSPFSQTGWSNYFDGSSSISYAANADFNFGTGTFTIEGWVYLASDSTGFVYGTGGSGQSDQFIYDSSSKQFAYYNGTSWSYSPTVSINQWVHFAAVRSGTTITVYANGSGGTGVTSSASIGSTTSAPYTGKRSDGSYNLTGYISNLRVIKGQALYTGTFTPSTSPLTTSSVGSTGSGAASSITGTVSLLTCQSNRFIDNSTSPKTVSIATGTPSVQAFSPFAPTAAYSASTNGGSGYFDGTGDYLTVADNTALDMEASDFTMEAFVYVTTSISTNITVFSKRASNAVFGGVLITCQTSNAPILRATTANASWDLVNATSSVSLVVGQWNHIAVARSGTSWAMWVNGARGISVTASGTVSNNTAAFGIGANADGSEALQAGSYLSGARVVKGTAVYTPSNSTITVPTSPPTNITNTSLLCNFTNAGITDATAKNDLETVGGAQISTTQSKFGGSSMYFDGTGDYLTISSPSSNVIQAFGTGNFTVEFWAYFNSVASGSVLDWRTDGNTGPLIYFSSSGTLVWYANGGAAITSTGWSTGQWYHIAVARSGTSTKMFRDGTQVGSTYTDSINYVCRSNGPVIAANLNLSDFANLYIDDLRITKGYARYTANFTAPTAAFPLS